MRSSIRLLASFKAAPPILTPGNPTGLTGLFTHPAPRSTLIHLYSSILQRLSALPESSAYRQGTHALITQRLQIIESVKPAGYDEWAERARKLIEDNPTAFGVGKGGRSLTQEEGRLFVSIKQKEPKDERLVEWDGREGESEARGMERIAEGDVEWEPEPPLSAEQVEHIETQIGAGLIEEVIQVAEGELKLVDVMAEHKVWDPLIETPAAGQWEYFERGSHKSPTQPPPTK